MMRRLFLVSLTVALSSQLSLAQESCPWLNSATAAGVLGHSVTVSVTHPGKSKEDAVCEFTTEAAVPSVLRIEVETMAHPAADFASWLAQCGAHGTQVRGIGNQAVACPLDKGSSISEQIVSRARDRALLVRVTTKKAVNPRPPLREQASTAAELAAGNLF